MTSGSVARLVLLFAMALTTSSCAILSRIGSEGDRLEDLIERAWSLRIQADPLLDGGTEEKGRGGLLSVAREDLRRRAEFERDLLEELRELDESRLSSEERINKVILERQLWDRVASFDFGAYQIPFTVDDGFHVAFARLPHEVSLDTEEDYRKYIDRLRAFPTSVDQHVVNMREGIERGMTMPRVVLEGFEVTIESHIVVDPRMSLFFEPFRRFPSGFSVALKDELEREGRDAILSGVVGGYRSFLRFFVEEYRPACRATVGASDLPNGENYYLQRVKYFTTLDLTPREIHDLGLREVDRIQREMQAILHRVEFDGDLSEFINFLRTDPRFYAKTPEELLKEASFIAKKMDAKLPSLFKTLPRLTYGVAPVPDHLAPKYTGGRFVPPAVGRHEPGYYWVNTYALESRPLYLLTPLTLHEAVPGHHLQHALALEQAEQPQFRRYDYISAYGEGWGLYSEWLGLEAGLYEDPYDDFGRLTYEMWRACRLVVDTGLHAFGWTREQALDYLGSHTALSLHEVRTETDRYISWPGQALSYKIGELKIKELRKRAETVLGGHFDVREFHDQVLGVGSVPLTVLETVITEWIEATVNQVN